MHGGVGDARPVARTPADPTPPPGRTEPSTMELPDLNQAVVDEARLTQLFSDIETCTQVLAVVPRYASRQFIAPTSVSLDEGKRMLVSRRVRAIQLRYLYDGSEWWDTLIPVATGTRIVRIRHDPDMGARSEQPGQSVEPA